MHPSNAKAVTSRFRMYTCVTCIPRIKIWTSLYPLVSAKQVYDAVPVCTCAKECFVQMRVQYGGNNVCFTVHSVCRRMCSQDIMGACWLFMPHKSSGTFWLTIWLGTLLNIYLWQRATEEKRTSPFSLSMNPRHTLAASWKMGHDLFTTEERLS